MAVSNSSTGWTLPQPNATAVGQAKELCEAVKAHLSSIDDMAAEILEEAGTDARLAALSDAIGHMARICSFKAGLAWKVLTPGAEFGWREVASCLGVPEEVLEVDINSPAANQG